MKQTGFTAFDEGVQLFYGEAEQISQSILSCAIIAIGWSGCGGRREGWVVLLQMNQFRLSFF